MKILVKLPLGNGKTSLFTEYHSSYFQIDLEITSAWEGWDLGHPSFNSKNKKKTARATFESQHKVKIWLIFRNSWVKLSWVFPSSWQKGCNQKQQLFQFTIQSTKYLNLSVDIHLYDCTMVFRTVDYISYMYIIIPSTFKHQKTFSESQSTSTRRYGYQPFLTKSGEAFHRSRFRSPQIRKTLTSEDES